MKIPNLQVALDHSNLEDGIAAAVAVGGDVDIIEAGTVMLLQTGTSAVRVLRKLFPKQTIVADTKCADAGKTVAVNCAQAGANLMTCICSASLPTIEAAMAEIGTIQIELYGDWTYEQAQSWRDLGIEHVIYHQSRDALLAGNAWGDADLKHVSALIEMGFKVSVTGGLNIETLAMFKGLAVYTFIAGRGITEALNPSQAAKDFKNEIKRIWGLGHD